MLQKPIRENPSTIEMLNEMIGIPQNHQSQRSQTKDLTCAKSMLIEMLLTHNSRFVLCVLYPLPLWHKSLTSFPVMIKR
jgi:hypothetical protein